MYPKTNTLAELSELIAFAVLYAPDAFPKRRQMDVGQLFKELFEGLTNCSGQISDVEKAKQAREMLTESLKAYQGGDSVRGAHLLQDVVALLGTGQRR